MLFRGFLIVALSIVFILGMKFSKNYGITGKKLILVNFGYLLFGGVGGVFGTHVMNFIESGIWGGRSYFGAVFIMPLIFIPFILIFKTPYWRTLDFTAISLSIMLMFLKISCLVSGCCGGRYLCTINETPIIFPSQLLESLNGLFLLIVLWNFAKKEKFRGKIYPLFLIFYGITRFILNFGRAEVTSLVLGSSNGHVWSIVSVLAGIACYFYLSNEETMQKIAQAKQN